MKEVVVRLLEIDSEFMIIEISESCRARAAKLSDVGQLIPRHLATRVQL